MRGLARFFSSIIVGAAILLVVASCAIIDEEQCLQGDWHYIGYADGERGFYPNARLRQIGEECGTYGVVPEDDLYREGHQLGLRWYCRPGNGYLLGEEGKEIADLCPSDLRPAFVQNYLSGLTLNMNNMSYKVLEYATMLDAFSKQYNQLLAAMNSFEKPSEKDLEEASIRISYATWWLAYYQFLLSNTEAKISRWSMSLN